MKVLEQDVRELLEEQRLLEEVMSLAQRCAGCPPEPVLDAVLSGAARARAALPTQPSRARP